MPLSFGGLAAQQMATKRTTVLGFTGRRYLKPAFHPFVSFLLWHDSSPNEDMALNSNSSCPSEVNVRPPQVFPIMHQCIKTLRRGTNVYYLGSIERRSIVGCCPRSPAVLLGTNKKERVGRLIPISRVHEVSASHTADSNQRLENVAIGVFRPRSDSIGRHIVSQTRQRGSRFGAARERTFRKTRFPLPSHRAAL